MNLMMLLLFLKQKDWMNSIIKNLLIYFWLFAITFFVSCFANEFRFPQAQIPIIQIQALSHQQQTPQQFVTYCDAYKHRNNIYFHENLHCYTTHQLQQYFNKHHYSEKEILDQELLYLSDEFVKLAKTYAGYEYAIERLHKKFKNFGPLKKFFHIFAGIYSSGLKSRIKQLYQEIQLKKAYQEEQKRKTVLQQASHSQHSLSDANVSEYQTLIPIYEQFSPLLAQAIEKRMHAHNQIKNGKTHFSTKTYSLNNQVIQLLSCNDIAPEKFKQCAGNQLQHALHEESVAILEHVTSLPAYSVLHTHKNALVDCTMALCDYNKVGMVDKASTIADFCWTLLDYGQAIAEGAALGLYAIAQDLITNPIEATVCIVAGKQVLAYQLCKVLYNVADIGITAINDYDHAKEKWDDYIAPINDLIIAIEKKEITVRDSLKAGTAFVVGYKAQSRLLGGLGKFCTTIKQGALNFATNNPLFGPYDYLTTPEGILLKATNQVKKSFEKTNSSNLKNVIENKIAKINTGHVAILKDGYYEVNGFKFTEYYYNRLWNKGRKAPSLIAKSILENATAVIPDPEKIPGFFKYFADRWEMIYNPTTKIVSHLQPIKEFK